MVIGEFGRGKSALVNALVGVPVCGVSARAPTRVPTMVKYGTSPKAELVPAPATDDGSPVPTRQVVPVGEVARLSLSDRDDTGSTYAAIEVELPRELLRDGVVLVDTAGVGGGFTAPGAAGTVRAVSFADALIFVTDASAELTAPEMEFLQESLRVCPTALCVVTKTDLYPRWRHIVELDRAHLASAGIDMPVLPVSSVLRELAVDTGDSALGAECGFAVLVSALSDGLRRRQRNARCRSAVGAATAALDQIGAQLAAEATTGSSSIGREDRAALLKSAEQRLARLHGASGRWQEALADEVRALRRSVPRDLSDRLLQVRQSAQTRIQDVEPLEHWGEFEPWLNRELNRQLAAHHRDLLARVRSCGSAVAAQLDVEPEDAQQDVTSVDLPSPSGLGRSTPLARPEERKISWVDVGVTAARGFSISGTVMSVLVVTAFGPASLVTFALTATLGSLLAARSVRGMRQAQSHATRAQVERAVLTHLDDVQRSTTRVDDDLLDAAYVQLRNHFSDLSDQQHKHARAVVAAMSSVPSETGPATQRRAAAIESRRSELAALRRSGEAALALANRRRPAAGSGRNG